MCQPRRAPALTLLLLGGLALPQIACGAKVDCEKMCKRTYRTCVEEVAVAKGLVDEKEVALAKKMGKKDKMFKQLTVQEHSRCLRRCARQKGFSRDARAINRCLKKRSCRAYAACIKKHL